jgi:hypothetical protein
MERTRQDEQRWQTPRSTAGTKERQDDGAAPEPPEGEEHRVFEPSDGEILQRFDF